jgi:hypothetical protein
MNAMRAGIWTIVAAFSLSLGALGGCSSKSSPPPCNEDPFECGTGQTCWVTDTELDFACLNSGSGQEGSSCAPTVDEPTCGDGLVCFAQQGGTTGTCLAFCDNTSTAHACSGGAMCTPVSFNGASASFSVCIGASTGPTPSDAGTSGG